METNGKEVIIDGVDVAECKRLWNGQCTGKDNKLLGNCIDLDCELKQLKRIEQELKEKDKLLKWLITQQYYIIPKNLKQKIKEILKDV